MELYKILHECLRVFPKQERYMLGQKIENTTLEILEHALAASYAPRLEKQEHIRRVSRKIDLLKYLIRLSYETKSLSPKKYLLCENKVLEIGRMAGGWLKSNS